MSETAPPERAERIVVALDASPQSVAALRTAAELALLLEAEVEGLFVEDINLLNLCDLPFGHEVGSYTAMLRRMDTAEMERQLRVLAAMIHEAMERVASQTSVRWSFRVRRGAVVEELLAAAQSAALLSVGRAGPLRRTGMGSTAQSLVDQAEGPLLVSGESGGLGYPLTVVYTGTPAARRALQLALRVSRREPAQLRVVVWSGGDVSPRAGQLEQAVRRLVEADAAHSGTHVTVVAVSETADLLTTLRELDGGTLVLPRDQAALVSQCSRSALLVP